MLLAGPSAWETRVNSSLPRGLALTALLALGLAPAAQASDTVYRWKDDRGNLVVSDRPPEDSRIEYDAVHMGPNAMTRTLTRPGPAAPSPAGTSRLEADTEKAGDRVTRVEKDPEICRTARDNLQTLDTFARIRTKDEDGEYYYLSEEEKEAQREQARELIRVHCE